MPFMHTLASNEASRQNFDAPPQPVSSRDARKMSAMQSKFGRALDFSISNESRIAVGLISSDIAAVIGSFQESCVLSGLRGMQLGNAVVAVDDSSVST